MLLLVLVAERADASTLGLTDHLPAELLAWDRSAPSDDPVPTSMRWDWRADRGDTLSMDGNRVLRGGAVVGEWDADRELRLGDAA